MKPLVIRQLTCCSALLWLATSGVSLAGNLTITTVASTVPPNGDLNPYGVALVPRSLGNLRFGHILVSNFNNSKNLQGTGTTIMDIAPGGKTTVFAQIDAGSLPGPCPGGVGLTTALVVLNTGWVIVGSLPTTDGTSATAQSGCLIVLDNKGKVAETITDVAINGPWDMTSKEQGTSASLFVTNVLNGTVAGGGNIVREGTVIRVDLSVLPDTMPSVQAITVIGSHFPEKTDPAALVIGPTGVALGLNGTLYVADSVGNRIAGIPSAATRTNSFGTGMTVLSVDQLNDPLGLAVLGNGSLMVVNGNNGLAINFTPAGSILGQGLLDKSGMPPGAGALFGLAGSSQGTYFVDDATNTLNLLAGGTS